MIKKIDNDDIDLIELLLIIKKDFLKILTIIFVALALTFIYSINQESNNVLIKAKTEIRPISTFDISEYELYNTYLKQNGSGYKKSTSMYKKRDERLNDELLIYDKLNEEFFLYDKIEIDKSLLNSFEIIDKKYLMNLFIDKLSENKIFNKAIKKFGLVKKENFESDEAYENSVKKLSSSIKLVSSGETDKASSWYIEYQTDNLDQWESFLLFVEKNTNLEVQKYISQNFNKLVNNSEKINSYRIEDINIEIENSTNNQKIEFLLKEKKTISNEKELSRLKKLFLDTPLSRPEEFYAAKVDIHSTKYKNLTKKEKNNITLFFSAIILGLVIGIFYVIIGNSMKNRLQSH